jgi:hypothetical protein
MVPEPTKTVALTEDERALVVFALDFVSADNESKRNELRAREQREWDMDVVVNLKDKLQSLAFELNTDSTS